MTIHETIKEQIKDALRAKDALRLEVLRGLQAQFSNDLIARGVSASLIADEDALPLIKRAVKQRKDSIEQFEKGGRSDLAQKERAELGILEAYLPATMSREDVEKVVAAKLTEHGGTLELAKKGQFVGMIMKELKGKAEGALVKTVVDEMVK